MKLCDLYLINCVKQIQLGKLFILSLKTESLYSELSGEKKMVIELHGKKIDEAHPPYIITEISENHNGKLENAFRLIAQRKEAGADAVKLWTYTADTRTLKSKSNDFIIKSGLYRYPAGTNGN